MRTIYDRVGGFPVVRKVVSTFYDRVFDAPDLARHFESTDMATLIDHQTRFVAFLLGGPAAYNDDHLERVHAHLRISLGDFDAMVELMVETLEDLGFEPGDVDHVERQLRQREALIVTVR